MSGKFLHTLDRTEGVDGYLLAGKVWSSLSYGQWESLYLETDGARLSIRGYNSGEGFTWEYARPLADGIDAKCSGSATTVEDACLSALKVCPELFTLDYLGRSFPVFTMPARVDGARQSTFIVDGEEAHVFGPLTSVGDPYYCWERHWAPAKEMLERFLSGPYLAGRKPSFQEALIAAVDAPEFFKRACGELVATLTRL